MFALSNGAIVSSSAVIDCHSPLSFLIFNIVFT